MQEQSSILSQELSELLSQPLVLDLTLMDQKGYSQGSYPEPSSTE